MSADAGQLNEFQEQLIRASARVVLAVIAIIIAIVYLFWPKKADFVRACLTKVWPHPACCNILNGCQRCCRTLRVATSVMLDKRCSRTLRVANASTPQANHSLRVAGAPLCDQI